MLSGAGEGLGMHWDSIKWPWLGLSGVGEGLGTHRIGQVGPRGAGSVRVGPSRAQ